MTNDTPPRQVNNRQLRHQGLLDVKASLDGETTVQDALDYLAEHAGNVPLSEVKLYFGHLSWFQEMSPEQIAERDQKIADASRRREAWERKTLAELKEKYE